MKYIYTTLANLALTLTALLTNPLSAFAQIADDDAKQEACKGITGDTANTNCGDPNFFGNVVTTVVNILTLIVGGISVIMLIVGGIRYVVSGGDPNATKGARDTILYAIIGIVVVASAQLIVRFVIGRI